MAGFVDLTRSISVDHLGDLLVLWCFLLKVLKSVRVFDVKFKILLLLVLSLVWSVSGLGMRSLWTYLIGDFSHHFGSIEVREYFEL